MYIYIRVRDEELFFYYFISQHKFLIRSCSKIYRQRICVALRQSDICILADLLAFIYLFVKADLPVELVKLKLENYQNYNVERIVTEILSYRVEMIK